MEYTGKAGIAALVFILVASCTKETLVNPPVTQTDAGGNIQLKTAGHYIGEFFGGGIVFLLDSTGSHGLIADTADLGLFTWWNGANITTGAKGINFGSGKSNTNKIITAQGKSGSYAALQCANSQRNGYTDWYLPSIRELMELSKHKALVGGFANYSYWSSTEQRVNLGMALDFFSLHYFSYHKDMPSYVRAIRAF